MKKVILKFVKFTIIGFTGAILALAALYFLTEKLQINYLISSLIIQIVFPTLIFAADKTLAFNEKLSSNFAKEYLEFMAIIPIGIILTIVILYIFTDILQFYYIISQIIATAIIGLAKFAVIKTYIFKKRRNPYP